LDQIDTKCEWKLNASDYDHSDDTPVLEGIRSDEVQWPSGLKHHINLVWPTKTAQCRDAHALEVLARLIKNRAEGATREGNRVKRGGTYHPAVEWDRSSSHGFIEVAFSTRGDYDHAKHLIERTLDVCDEIRTDRSSLLEEDVKDVREYLAESWLEDFRYVPSAFANRMLAAVADGDTNLERFNAYRANMKRVSADRVRAVAERYLKRNQRVQVIVRPIP